MRFWRNSDDVIKVRVYRVPEGTEGLPIEHGFMHTDWLPEPGPEPGEPGVPVGMFPTGTKYDKGSLPVGWRPPTHFIGGADQWLDGSIVGVHDELDWCGAFSTQCKMADQPFDDQCLRQCVECPLTSMVWRVEDFENFSVFKCSAICHAGGCNFSNAVIDGVQDSPHGTAAAWEVVLPENFGPLTNGVVAYVGNNTFSTCCTHRKGGGV